MGANDFLMGYLVRFEPLGLTLENYRERLSAASRRMARRSDPQLKPEGDKL